MLKFKADYSSSNVLLLRTAYNAHVSDSSIWLAFNACVWLQVIRYMEDKLRQRDAMTEKLRLKNTTLKGQLQKV